MRRVPIHMVCIDNTSGRAIRYLAGRRVDVAELPDSDDTKAGLHQLIEEFRAHGLPDEVKTTAEVVFDRMVERVTAGAAA